MNSNFHNILWKFNLTPVSFVAYARSKFAHYFRGIFTVDLLYEIKLFLAWLKKSNIKIIFRITSLQYDTFNLLIRCYYKLLANAYIFDWNTSKCIYPRLHDSWFVFIFQARKLISDFAIILSILIFCVIDALIGVDTPKLIVPSEFKVGKLSFRHSSNFMTFFLSF